MDFGGRDEGVEGGGGGGGEGSSGRSMMSTKENPRGVA